jgi:hypothetical protein
MSLVRIMFDMMDTTIKFFKESLTIFIDSMAEDSLLTEIKNLVVSPHCNGVDLYKAHMLNFQLRNNKMALNIINDITSKKILLGCRHKNVIIIAKVGKNHIGNTYVDYGIDIILKKNSIKYFLHEIDENFDLGNILELNS